MPTPRSRSFRSSPSQLIAAAGLGACALSVIAGGHSALAQSARRADAAPGGAPALEPPIQASTSPRFHSPSTLAATGTEGATTSVAGGSASGRDFAGLRLNVPEQPGAVSISALRATTWTEEPALAENVANATIGGPVQRLLLRGDVHISLGVYDFSAARAVVWLEYLGPSSAGPGTDLYQVAIYFDRVGEPTAGAGTVQSGDRLLVTGLVAGNVSLNAASVRQGRPALSDVAAGSSGAAPGDGLLLAEGEQRLARLLNELARPAGSPPGPDSSLPPPRVPGSAVITPAPGLGPMVPGVSRPFEPGSLLGREAVYGPLVTSESAVATGSPAQRVSPTRTDPLFSPSGLVTFAAGEPTLVAGGDENAVVITGGVVVQYTDPARARTLQISALRAVAFLDPGPIADILRSPSDRVRGVYLEGDAVATDGTYTLRGQSIYYDFRANRAIVLDAVFSTYDQRRAMPLYVRAKTLMQTAANQVTGEGVRLANSSFFTPHLSIGASSITVTRQQPQVDEDGNASGVATTYLQGSDITLRAGNTPFFYFPEFEGDVLNFPLRDIRVENSSRSGAAIKTSFDAFGLLSITPPPGFRADLLVDGYTKRGAGIGTVGSNDTGDARGEWLAYLVPDDRGTDQLTTGVERQQSGRARGILLGDQRIDLSDRWSVFLEGAYISDVNFVDAYYEPLAETRREFANAAYLRFCGNNSAFGLVAKGSLNAFTPNEYLLQSLGYTVDRLPEATYSRVADDLLPGLAPGMLQWTSEYRAGRLSLSLENRSPRDIGLINNFTSQRAFGLNAADNIAQALRARGLTSADVFRADTRQELAGTFSLGPVTLNPFVVGRITAYDNDFAAFRAASDPTNNDKLREWHAAGISLSSSIQHVDNDVESRLLDLHRIRHIIEPQLTLWTAGTNIKQSSLPIYDEQVESLAEGSAARFSLANIFQTQRGGEGRWRSVDVLRVDPAVQFASSDTDRESPLKNFFDDRPEYSQLGDAFTLDAAYQVTDAAALSFSQIYDLDTHQTQRISTGLVLDHTADFRTFVEMHYLHPRESTFVSFGGQLRLTRKYTVDAAATYDVDMAEFQELSARLNREFPSFLIGLKIRYNNITDEVSLGFVLTPQTRDTRREQLRRLGRDQIADAPDSTVPAASATDFSTGPVGSGTVGPGPTLPGRRSSVP